MTASSSLYIDTITLYPTDHIYVLRPNLEALVAAQAASLAAPSLTQRLSTASASERRESLTNEFGSKKKKRALQAMKSNIISSENIYAGNKNIVGLAYMHSIMP
ncbi:hypothetical protein EON65_52090 [archaeon]|nr:MAG: hypothetical protein EON65_52090 [archaeon]